MVLGANDVRSIEPDLLFTAGRSGITGDDVKVFFLAKDSKFQAK